MGRGGEGAEGEGGGGGGGGGGGEKEGRDTRHVMLCQVSESISHTARYQVTGEAKEYRTVRQQTSSLTVAISYGVGGNGQLLLYLME